MTSGVCARKLALAVTCTALAYLLTAQASAQTAPDAVAKVTVDSTFRGYGSEVLTDGKWIAEGEEPQVDIGSAEHFGNVGNTWVSGLAEGAEHWIRLDWPEPVTINQLQAYWAWDKWRPKAFRVEYLSDESWVPVSGAVNWFEATQRRTIVTFEALQVQSVRVVQFAGGGGADRGLMAAQEVTASNEPGGRPGLEGARKLSAAELKRLMPLKLQRNIARLNEDQPGAVSYEQAVPGNGLMLFTDCPEIADGDLEAPIKLPPGATGVTLGWTKPHVVDSLAVYFAQDLPQPKDVTPQLGHPDLPLALDCEAQEGQRRLVFTFEPVAIDRLTIPLDPGGHLLTEVEVYRYLPSSPSAWPERLITDNQLEREILGSGKEPSYEALCSTALSMIPAHALLGLKDDQREIGVKWDGTIVARDTLTFAFGPDLQPLRARPDTVTRALIDDWRPGTVVRGQIGELAITQTAFVCFADEERSRPALCVRTEVSRLSEEPFVTRMQAAVSGPATKGLVVKDGCILRGEALVLASADGTAGTAPGGLQFDLDLTQTPKATVDLVYPYQQDAPIAEAGTYRKASLDAARARFVEYWDELLAPAMRLNLPEKHLQNMYKAVLTQVLICADGDILPYGTAPSVYDGNLYGLEEGYAMMALIMAGLQEDAVRYMDATYLTPEFLKKVDQYKVYADRHQQYRNGLQPFYAVSAYRFTRDGQWIRKHLDLLRECAEWTVENRRKTMQETDGDKPLHFGLLPKWSYGGDISGLQCYPLYANFTCWRGLWETAWLLEQLGRPADAERYYQEAADYRAAIDRAVDGNYKPEHEPPFLPLRLYADEPVGNDYYQLFAGTLLDLMPFDPGGKRIGYITDYLQDANLTFCLLPRFRRDVGAGGLDGLYGLGLILTKLHQGKIDEFLLGLYAYLAFNMDRTTFASRETNLIYASDLHERSKYRVPDMSDPIPCSSVVALQLLRHMLVAEQLEGRGVPSGNLLLLAGAPRRWFADGKVISFSEAPTQFGPMECRVVSQVAEGRISATLKPPIRDRWGSIRLRIRHPEGLKMRSVTVNGRDWTDYDAEAELVTLTAGSKSYKVVCEY